MKILVLGHRGMLGHMVEKYLKDNSKFQIETTDLRWPEEGFKNYLSKSDADFIINCIGAIPQRKRNFEVNWELPVWLEQNTNSKIIHPGTDCEIDSDDYGVSKKKAVDFILKQKQNTKIIKTSIIGPELNSNSSLMGWFLSNPDGSIVKGYASHFWNGNTTLTWAKFCEGLILDWEKYGYQTILSSMCVSKYELLTIMNSVFSRSVIIESYETTPVFKCLDGDIQTDPIDLQIKELVDFYGY